MKELKLLPEVLRAFANYVEGNGPMVQVQFHPGLNDNWYELQIGSSNYLYLNKHNHYRLKPQKTIIPWTPEVAVKYLGETVYSKETKPICRRIISIEKYGLRLEFGKYYSWEYAMLELFINGKPCGTEVEK